jgi:hypothetical protein
MSQETGIEWCHHTKNPVRGCTKISDGCKHTDGIVIVCDRSKLAAAFAHVAAWVLP